VGFAEVRKLAMKPSHTGARLLQDSARLARTFDGMTREGLPSLELKAIVNITNEAFINLYFGQASTKRVNNLAPRECQIFSCLWSYSHEQYKEKVQCPSKWLGQ
jgi:hypothetical protein